MLAVALWATMDGLEIWPCWLRSVGLAGDGAVGDGAVDNGDDIFIIFSRLGKIIRFRASEIPAKEGVVQGVACMALRSDETAAFAIARL